MLDTVYKIVPVWITITFLLLGTIRAIFTLHRLFLMLKQHYVTTGYDLNARYGKDSWAVVTGASDGIGAEYSSRLAGLGFNIVLVSRTLSKLEAVQSRLNKESPSVKTRIVQIDLAGTPSFDHFRKIFTATKDLDVSLVVANAGMMNVALFAEMPVI